MVRPKIQFPDWAGIVVLDLPFPECLDSTGVTIGAGPPPLAADVVISDLCELCRW